MIALDDVEFSLSTHKMSGSGERSGQLKELVKLNFLCVAEHRVTESLYLLKLSYIYLLVFMGACAHTYHTHSRCFYEFFSVTISPQESIHIIA